MVLSCPKHSRGLELLEDFPNGETAGNISARDTSGLGLDPSGQPLVVKYCKAGGTFSRDVSKATP